MAGRERRDAAFRARRPQALVHRKLLAGARRSLVRAGGRFRRGLGRAGCGRARCRRGRGGRTFGGRRRSRIRGGRRRSGARGDRLARLARDLLRPRCRLRLDRLLRARLRLRGLFLQRGGCRRRRGGRRGPRIGNNGRGLLRSGGGALLGGGRRRLRRHEARGRQGGLGLRSDIMVEQERASDHQRDDDAESNGEVLHRSLLLDGQSRSDRGESGGLRRGGQNRPAATWHPPMLRQVRCLVSYRSPGTAKTPAEDQKSCRVIGLLALAPFTV